MKVGQIEGQLTSLERRMDRHETTVWSKLDGMDGKIDRIETMLSAGNGEQRGRAGLMHWIATAAGMALAWWSGHTLTGGTH